MSSAVMDSKERIEGHVLPLPLARGENPTNRNRADARHVVYLLLFLTALFVSHTALPSVSVPKLPSLLRHRHHSTVQPLDPAFVSGCHALLAPTASTYTARLARLSSALSAADASPRSPKVIYVAEPGPSAGYFLGAFSSADWWLSERPFLAVFVPSSAADLGLQVILLTPKFEELRARGIALPEQVEKHVRWLSWQESESPYEVLLRDLQATVGVDTILIEDEVRNFIASGLKDAAKSLDLAGGAILDSAAAVQQVQEAVWAIRETKDEREIGLLRCANQLTLHAIRMARSRMYIGITESETRDILHKELAATGLVGGEGLVLFGENAALPHGSGTDRVLGKDDLVLIDVGGQWGGYVADITRTFALPGSKIPTAHLEIWETVRRAQYAPYELLASTNTSELPALASLDVAARAVISERMLGVRDGDHMAVTGSSASSPDFSIFTHRLGHGIGLQGHEAPYLVQGMLGAKKLRKGNVFSLEPGVYIPRGSEEAKKRGLSGVGVRLEDCFAVTVTDEGRFDGEWLSGPVRKWGDI